MFGAVSCHSSPTQELSRKLDLQEKAWAIILGSQYKSYSNALTLTQLPRLDTLHPKHTDLFPLGQAEVNTRNRNMFREYF